MEENSTDGSDDSLSVEALDEHSEEVREDDEQPQYNDESTEAVRTQLIEEDEESVDEVDSSEEDSATPLEREPVGVEEIDWVAEEIEEQFSLTNALESVDCRSTEDAAILDQSEAADAEVVSEETRFEEGGMIASDFAETLEANKNPEDYRLAVEEKLSEFAEDCQATTVEEVSGTEEHDEFVNGDVHRTEELVDSTSEEVKDVVVSQIHGVLEEDDAGNTKEKEFEVFEGIKAARVNDLTAEFDQSQSCNEFGERVVVEEVIASKLGTSDEPEKLQDSIFVEKSGEHFGISQKETEIGNNNLNDRILAPSATWRNCCGILDFLMKSKA